MGGLIGLVILAALTIGVIAVVRRVTGKSASKSTGGDIVAYLLLAIAVGTTAFSLAELGIAAFPGDTTVGDAETQVATALAGLVVAGPIAFVLWRRQAERRAQNAESTGWVLYLAAIEVTFMTALASSAFGIVYFLAGDGDSPQWVDAIVFLGVIVFHEWAVRQTPPIGDASGFYRVIGSAIGLIAGSIGLAGMLYWLFDKVYATLTPTSSEAEAGVWLAFLVVGVPIWAYRWWKPWDTEPGIPRKTWLVITTVTGLAVAIGTATSLVVLVLLFVFSDTDSAAIHFSPVPGIVGTGLVAWLVWAHHRGRMGSERSTAIQFYEYVLAAIGMATAIGAATGLTTVAFAPADFINAPTDFTITVTTILVSGLLVWGFFWNRAQRAPREIEVAATPRKLYLVGFAVVTGLTAAGALIGTLVVLFQWVISGETSDSLAIQASLFVFSGLATWHLIRQNLEDRELTVSPEVMTPFAVTVICSHPGKLAAMFPDGASIRVVYRGDEQGVITEDMAESIVEQVGRQSSIVWVDGDGYRVAPSRD